MNTSIQKIISVLFIFYIIISCNGQSNSITNNEKSKSQKTESPPKKIRLISQLTQNEIKAFIKENPCYLPLLKDSSYWERGMPVGFNATDLYNDVISENSPYRNRYIVGDFNALNPDGSNRTVKELYPQLDQTIDFKGLSKEWLDKIQNCKPHTPEFDTLLETLRRSNLPYARQYLNFLNKVWKYKLVPITREYSVEGNGLYAAGHYLVLCEACKDTLILHAKFASSPKSKDIGITSTGKRYNPRLLPINNFRYYYAGLYRLTSKNWETQRKYDSLDIAHDRLLGGGNNQVTFFKGNVELPNFILMAPSKEYPKAMRQNGIHEVALHWLPNGMLGTPNSIGCLRVSDFGSKYIRWWIPQAAKLFVVYNESLYFKQYTIKDSISNYLPLKNQLEGDAFRAWIRRTKPKEAEMLEIDEKGNFKSGHLIDAYYYFKDEYQEFLKSNQKK